jgi:hypothetical protein
MHRDEALLELGEIRIGHEARDEQAEDLTAAAAADEDIR